MRALRSSLLFILVAAGAFTTFTAAPASAQDGGAEITVSAGDPTRTSFRPECSDVIVSVQESTSFVFHRTGGNLAAPLTISLKTFPTEPSATPGVDYQAFPATLTFTAGDPEAVLPIVPIRGETTHQSDIVVAPTLTDGIAYHVGQPGLARASFIAHRDPARGAVDCGLAFDEGEQIDRHVSVGGTLAALSAFEIEGDDGPLVFSVADGSLPAGVTLNPDGTFAGQPTKVGASSATVRACRADRSGCTAATLRISVTSPTAAPTSSSSSSTIPVTGSGTRSTGLLGALVLACGLVFLGTSFRRSA